MEFSETKNSANSGLSQVHSYNVPTELENVNKAYSTQIGQNSSQRTAHKNAGLIMNYALGLDSKYPVENAQETHLDETSESITTSSVSSEDCIPKDLWDAIENVVNKSLFVESLDSRLFIEPELTPATPRWLHNMYSDREEYSSSPQVLPSPFVQQTGSVLSSPHNNNLCANQFTPRYRFPNYFGPVVATNDIDVPIRVDSNHYVWPNHSNFSVDVYGGHAEIPKSGYNMVEICEQIWRHGDQKASLFLQERVKACIPGEYELLVDIIHDQSAMLMVHRFGNFLVQSMLETAKPEDIEKFTSSIIGQIAYFSTNQFCCHVMQKLLDVGPIVVQARIAYELLDQVYTTMTSPFGTHVWQKLLQLPWSKQLPSLAGMTHNAVRSQMPENGWVSIAKTESGCTSVRSYLCLNQKDCAECANDLLDGLYDLMTCEFNTSPVVSKLALLSSTRARTMTQIFSRAYEYSRHPIGSQILVHLFQLKIPSFPARFSSAISTYRSRMEDNEYTINVVEALNRVQGANGNGN